MAYIQGEEKSVTEGGEYVMCSLYREFGVGEFGRNHFKIVKLLKFCFRLRIRRQENFHRVAASDSNFSNSQILNFSIGSHCLVPGISFGRTRESEN